MEAYNVLSGWKHIDNMRKVVMSNMDSGYTSTAQIVRQLQALGLRADYDTVQDIRSREQDEQDGTDSQR